MGRSRDNYPHNWWCSLFVANKEHGDNNGLQSKAVERVKRAIERVHTQPLTGLLLPVSPLIATLMMRENLRWTFAAQRVWRVI